MCRLSTIDVHVAGEPLRVVTEGFPEPQGQTILEKRRNCRERLDDLRRALMWEPRGHQDMYGCVLISPCQDNVDVGVLFFHNEGYSTMCGHGIIGLVTVLIDQGTIQITEPETAVRLETPSGVITARASVKHGRVDWVRFQNVPSFVSAVDQVIEVPGIGPLPVDIGFGGAFYGFVKAEGCGVDLIPEQAQWLAHMGMTIKQSIIDQCSIQHPFDPELGFLYGTIFVGPPQKPQSDCRQVCIFADGALDRSPTGTGVSAQLALLASRNLLQDHEPYVVESILGTTFTGRIRKRMMYDGRPAIIPEIEGRAYITGRHEFVLDPDDPLCHGFLLGHERVGRKGRCFSEGDSGHL